MDDLIVTLIFLALALVGWVAQRIQRANQERQRSEKPQITLEDVLTEVQHRMEGEEPPSPIEGASQGRATASPREGVEEAQRLEAEEASPGEESLPSREEPAEPGRPSPPEPPPPSAAESAPPETQERKPRTLAGITFDARNMRRAIIMMEVMGKPKCRRS